MSRTLSLKAPRYPITSIIIIEKSIIINYLIVISYYTFIVPKEPSISDKPYRDFIHLQIQIILQQLH